MTPARTDLARSTLGVLAILSLIVAAFWVLRPFLGPGIWAATIVITTWPLMSWLQARLWGRRSLAVALMTLGLLGALIMPVTLAIVTIVQHVDDVVALTARLGEMRLPAAPAWLAALPLVGPKIGSAWEAALASGAEGLFARLAPYARPVVEWFVKEVGSVGYLLLQSVLVVVLSAIMYARGEDAADGLKKLARRLAGAHGEEVLVLSAQATRGVALGVGITAAVQGALGGIGLAIAGVPYSALLTVVMFLFSLAQLGPFPVLLPAAAWMFWSDQTGWGSFLIGVALVAGTLDNVLRPFLIRMGADLPLLLVFSGVVGGMLAFGLVGIFIGPVVLSVAFTLLKAWVREEPPAGG